MAEKTPDGVNLKRTDTNVEDLAKVDRDPTTNRLAYAENMTPEERKALEKKLKLKLDFRLALTIWIIFILNYLDRNNIAAAKVAGLQTDLGLTSQQYSTAVAILFVGYILIQIPSNVFLCHLRPSIYLPACMMVWGALSCLTSTVKTAGQLYACRFFLGLVEAAFYPGALFLISSWYKRSEMGVRSALLFSGTQVGSAFSGLIAAGIQYGLDGARGYHSWQWMFIIEGSITVFIAMLSMIILPDFPSTTRWLSPQERAIAEWRLIEDAGQVDEDDAKWSVGFKLAFRDWRLYVFIAIFFCIQVASATHNFFPAVVETLGFGRVNTLLLTVPPYMLGLVVSICNNLSADRFRNSSYHIVWPLALAIIGFVVGASTLKVGPRYFAMMLMVAGGHGSNAVLLAWCQKTMLRPRIKRASTVAAVNAVANTAQVWTSYLYMDSSAPRYIPAMATNSAFTFAAIALTLMMRMILLNANKKLDRGELTVAEVMQGESGAEIKGITEEERLARKEAFRYIA